MTTLAIVYKRNREHRNGVTCVGLCDERCYNAMPPSKLKEPRRNACICICGGRNHGAGQAKAVQNAAAGVGLGEEDAVRFAQERGFERDELVVIDRLRIPRGRARRFANQLLNPPVIHADDLFFCEAV